MNVPVPKITRGTSYTCVLGAVYPGTRVLVIIWADPTKCETSTTSKLSILPLGGTPKYLAEQIDDRFTNQPTATTTLLLCSWVIHHHRTDAQALRQTVLDKVYRCQTGR